jgi:hypothetical protein
MSISNPSFTNASIIEYWNGNEWVSVASTFTAPDTVSGTVPASALTGTPIVVGTSKQNSTSWTSMIEVTFALIAGLIIAAVAIAQLMLIAKNRKRSLPASTVHAIGVISTYTYHRNYLSVHPQLT